MDMHNMKCKQSHDYYEKIMHAWKHMEALCITISYTYTHSDNILYICERTSFDVQYHLSTSVDYKMLL